MVVVSDVRLIVQPSSFARCSAHHLLLEHLQPLSALDENAATTYPG
jgi:hypothetical protein